jgi:hypothetical protein
MLSNAKRTYALADFTVEGKAGKWFYWKTARYGDREERHGPYSSISSAAVDERNHETGLLSPASRVAPNRGLFSRYN